MVQLGIKGHQEMTVGEAQLASTIDSGTVTVFATAFMIALMERTAVYSVEPYLEEGQSTVGIGVNVTHVSATPCGMKVWADSELVAIDRRKLTFTVRAYDEKGLIGEGTHERFIINKVAFEQKTAGKLG